jgi:hypothetical protein
MTALHSINDPRRELHALLVEQRGEPSYGKPARRFAFMLAERISSNHSWYDSNENAVRFLDAFAHIAGRMAGRSSIHPDLRRRLSGIVALTGRE